MEETERNAEQAGEAQVKREESQCNNAASGRGLGTPTAESSGAGNITNPADQPDSKRVRGQRSSPGRRANFGGILRQLKARNRRQLAYYRSQIEELEDEYLQLEGLANKLESEVDEVDQSDRTSATSDEEG